MVSRAFQNSGFPWETAVHGAILWVPVNKNKKLAYEWINQKPGYYQRAFRIARAALPIADLHEKTSKTPRASDGRGSARVNHTIVETLG
jgi:hypothetical protein